MARRICFKEEYDTGMNRYKSAREDSKTKPKKTICKIAGFALISLDSSIRLGQSGQNALMMLDDCPEIKLTSSSSLGLPRAPTPIHTPTHTCLAAYCLRSSCSWYSRSCVCVCVCVCVRACVRACARLCDRKRSTKSV